METLKIALSVVWIVFFAIVIILTVCSIIGCKVGKEQDKIIKNLNKKRVASRRSINLKRNNSMNEKAEFAVRVLKQYALENQIPARSTSDLSPMEQWLILRLLAVIKSLPEPDEIRMKARELDEKDFAQWMYELQKGNVL